MRTNILIKNLGRKTAVLLAVFGLFLTLSKASRANQVEDPKTAVAIRFRVKNTQFHRKVASPDEINNTIKAIGGKVIKTFPNVPGLYIVRLQGKYDMKAAQAKLDNTAFVIYSEDLSAFATVPVYFLEFSE